YRPHQRRAARARVPTPRAVPVRPRRRRAATARGRRLPSSGTGLGDQAAKSTLATTEFGDRAFERGAVEVGPVGRDENEFAIGRLPEQKIRQSLLTAGTDD